MHSVLRHIALWPHTLAVVRCLPLGQLPADSRGISRCDHISTNDHALHNSGQSRLPPSPLKMPVQVSRLCGSKTGESPLHCAAYAYCSCWVAVTLKAPRTPPNCGAPPQHVPPPLPPPNLTSPLPPPQRSCAAAATTEVTAIAVAAAVVIRLPLLLEAQGELLQVGEQGASAARPAPAAAKASGRAAGCLRKSPDSDP